MLNLLTTLQVLQIRGICHRDIKPQNILVNKNRYFLCDFDEAILTKIGNQ
jgi:serine/threonine protein kinase